MRHLYFDEDWMDFLFHCDWLQNFYVILKRCHLSDLAQGVHDLVLISRSFLWIQSEQRLKFPKCSSNTGTRCMSISNCFLRLMISSILLQWLVSHIYRILVYMRCFNSNVNFTAILFKIVHIFVHEKVVFIYNLYKQTRLCNISGLECSIQEIRTVSQSPTLFAHGVVGLSILHETLEFWLDVGCLIAGVDEFVCISYTFDLQCYNFVIML